MTEWTGNGADWARNAPVFASNNEFEWGGRTWPYPDVWVTEQRCEPTAERTGRMCVGHYTPDTDPDGDDALYYGGGYYDEGMACMGEGEHEKRIMCFQAAELLYLHASNLGNPFGDLCLGYVYSYDRCEGSYWGGERPFDPEGHALAHFGAAARAGIPEACYKYGDLLRDGRGCDANFDEAYLWFSRAWESADEERASRFAWGRPTRWARAAGRGSTWLVTGTSAPSPGCPSRFAKGTRGIAAPCAGRRRVLRGASRS